MKTPSFLVSYKDGEPVVELCTMDAQAAKDAYRDSDKSVQLYLKATVTKSKKAPKKPAKAEQEPEAEPKPKKKAGRPKKG